MGSKRAHSPSSARSPSPSYRSPTCSDGILESSLPPRHHSSLPDEPTGRRHHSEARPQAASARSESGPNANRPACGASGVPSIPLAEQAGYWARLESRRPARRAGRTPIVPLAEQAGYWTSFALLGPLGERAELQSSRLRSKRGTNTRAERNPDARFGLDAARTLWCTAQQLRPCTLRSTFDHGPQTARPMRSGAGSGFDHR